MVPTQTLESFPVFSDTGTKVKPGDAKYSAGFQQSDVLPAEWVNWEWNKASKGITDLNTGLASVEAEINSVLTGADKSPDATKTNQLLESIAKLIDDAEGRAKIAAFNAAHPVGEIYVQYPQQDDPETLFNTGGITSTWTLQTQYDGAFFRASGGNAANFVEKTDTLTKQGQATAKNGLEVYSAASGGSASTTGAMSGNSTGSVTKALFESGPSRSGNITLTNGASWTRGYSGSTSSWSEYTLNVGVAHTHNMYLRSTDTETRPANFTVKIWKRTA